MLVSGQTGPGNYQTLSEGLAAQGFDVVVFDGNDVWAKGVAGGTLLRRVIERAQASPNAAPGKVGVVGASLGGATASGVTSSPIRCAARSSSCGRT